MKNYFWGLLTFTPHWSGPNDTMPVKYFFPLGSLRVPLPISLHTIGPPESPWKIFDLIYRKVASSSMSRLVARFQIFRRLIKGKFDAYVLWPLAKKVQNWIVDRSTARDFTVIKFCSGASSFYGNWICNLGWFSPVRSKLVQLCSLEFMTFTVCTPLKPDLH